MDIASADVEIEDFPLVVSATGTGEAYAHLLVQCDFEKWAGWEIFDIRVNVGTPMRPKFEPVNDPDAVQYLRSRLENDERFKRLADDTHDELFSPEAEYEAEMDRRTDYAREGWAS